MYIYFDENSKMVFNDDNEVMTGDLLFKPESLSYFSRMDEQPTDERKILINTFLGGLIDNDIWNRIDILRLSACHASQAALLNAKGDYWNAELAGTTGVPTFTVDRGFAGQLTVKWILTNFNPYNGGCMYTQDDAMGLVYNNTIGGTSYYYIYGGSVIGGMIHYNNSAASYGTINSSSATSSNDGIGSRLQFKWIRRQSSAGFHFGTNLTPSAFRARTSANLIDASFTDGYGPTRQALIMIGGALDDSQLAIFQFFALNYLKAVGADI